ncbi:aspartate aminotransferase family protein [Pelagibius litoralis]|uniref:Aspartate aminotransferase family protein n=1 Tax=Pelagibius litoralis TaxID=374515 RepID=A0A967KGL1_9PROT|nr:aspartate aminotransferase family protein [Pelagibius litoralis]NIA72270.1 aspartate aminotransferase family protein [Pelagibius litoralis]
MTPRNGSAVFYRDLTGAPPLILHGEGVYLEDADGRRYLDGSASASVVGIGHGRREIWDALAAEGGRVTFVYSGGFTHPWQERLAAAILDLAPANMAAVYFTSGGSEANESAWKLARQYFVEQGKHQKYKAIARWQSYHGVTLATLSLSGRTSWRQIYAPLLLPVPHVAPPYEYRCAFCERSGGCTLACADDLERTILLEGPDTVAVFFAEPIVGTTVAGLVPHSGYYRRIREICDRYDVLFVADEVLCGYGRSGAPFAIAGWDVEPDIITLGKALGSGYAPLAAMLVSDKIRQVFLEGSGRFVHGLTYSGTPSACFVGLKVHEIMLREGLFTRAKGLGGVLKSKLLELAGRHEIIGEVRGRGLLQGIELVADRKSRRPFPPGERVTERVVRHMRDNGVIVAAGVPLANFGRDGDHLQISPPFIITGQEISIIVEALDDALRSVQPSVG